MATQSTMLRLGTQAPKLELSSLEGNIVGVDDFADSPALLVMFLCNHCPYVRHVEDVLARLLRDYEARGVAAIGICSNDAEAYLEDGPEGLRAQVERANFGFPYLIDDTQDIAKAYRAACTPDFFVFNEERRLVYRGQMDSSRPGRSEPVTGEDLRGALDALLASEPVPQEQYPSMGCGIKWRPRR